LCCWRKRVRRRCGHALWHAPGAHLVRHDGRRRRVRRAVRLEMGIRRRLAGWLRGHVGLLEAWIGGLLRCFGTRRRNHARRLSRRLTHTVLARSRSFGRDDRVGLIHWIRKGRRRITHWAGAILLLVLLLLLHGYCHLLRIRELRIELGRVAHKGGWVHHGGRVVGVWETVAIVVLDSGFVHPGAHD
jgi:hypothetical protein